mmetsp:Transcript_33670/g.82778  ORF Transcript_33670/g.82778 Transcript_33670/m.82778 type:complete len:132 (+) Transcript_33670:72-467(+)
MPPRRSKKDDNSEKFQLAFGTKSLREDFNRPAAIYLRDNIGQYIENDESADKAMENIKNLLDNSMGASHIMVTYTKAKKADGDGRWFSKCMGSMQGMSRGVRQTICKDMWIDLDFVNCHQVLLSQLCKKLG